MKDIEGKILITFVLDKKAKKTRREQGFMAGRLREQLKSFFQEEVTAGDIKDLQKTLRNMATKKRGWVALKKRSKEWELYKNFWNEVVTSPKTAKVLDVIAKDTDQNGLFIEEHLKTKYKSTYPDENDYENTIAEALEDLRKKGYIQYNSNSKEYRFLRQHYDSEWIEGEKPYIDLLIKYGWFE